MVSEIALVLRLRRYRYGSSRFAIISFLLIPDAPCLDGHDQ